MWDTPVGFKLVLYFGDNTEYVMNAAEDPALAIVVTKTMRDNIVETEVREELDQMLGGQ